MDVIKTYADKKDLKALKYIFIDSLDSDPTFERYEEGYNYCKSCGLLEPHRELSPLIYDKSKWDQNYWEQLKGELFENFSDKRMTHMREVAKVIFKDKIDRIRAERAERAAVQARQQPNTPPSTHASTQNTSIPKTTTVPNNSRSMPKELSREADQERFREAQRKLEQENQRTNQERKARAEAHNKEAADKLRNQPEELKSKKALGIALTAAAVVAAVVIVAIIVK